MPARVNKALLFGLIGGLVVIAVVVAVMVLWKEPLEDRRRNMLRQADEHSEKGERQQEIFLLQGWISEHRDDRDLRDIHLRLARLYEDGKQSGYALRHYREVVNMDPNHMESLLKVAEYAGQQRDYEEMERRAEAALSIQPGSVLGQLYMAQASLMRGKYTEATVYARSVVKTDPKNVGAYLVLVDALKKRGDLNADERKDEVLKVLETALKENPDSPDILMAMARMKQIDDVGGAEEAFKQAVKAVKTDDETSHKAAVNANLGLATFYVQQAREEQQQADAKDRRAETRKRRGDEKEAEDILKEAEGHRKQVQHYYKQAERYYRFATDNAVDTLDRRSTRIYRGNFYFSRRRYDDALKQYDEALQAVPDNPDALLRKARVLLTQSQFDEARKPLETVMARGSLDGAHVMAMYLDGRRLVATGQAEKGINQLEECLRLIGDKEIRGVNVLDIRGFLGETYLRLNDFPKARANLTLVHRQAPKNWAITFNLARALYGMQEFDQVVSLLRTAHGRPEGYELLASAYEALGDTREGYLQMAQAARLSPKSAGLRLKLARLGLRLKRYDIAMAQIKEAERLAPDAPDSALLKAVTCEMMARDVGVKVINDFESAAHKNRFKDSTAKIEVVEEHATKGKHSLKVTWESGKTLSAFKTLPPNWSQYAWLEFDLWLPKDATFVVGITDRDDEDDRRFATWKHPLKAGANTVTIGLDTAAGSIDLKKVSRFRLRPVDGSDSVAGFIDNVRLRQNKLTRKMLTDALGDEAPAGTGAPLEKALVDLADQAYGKVLEKAPDRDRLYMRYALFLNRHDRYADGEKVLLDAIQKHTDAKTRKIYDDALVSYYWQTGNLKAARDRYRKRAEADPKNVEDREQLVTLAISDKDFDAAATWLAQVKQLVPDTMRSLRLEGQYLAARGQYKKALDVLLQAREKAPDNPAVSYYVGTCYLRLDKPREAIECLESLPPSFRNMGRVKQDLMQAYYYTGEFGKANKLSRELEKSGQGSMFVDFVRAQSSQRLGKPQEGEQYWRELLKKRPDMPDAWLGLGDSLLAQGKDHWVEATDVYKKAYELDKGSKQYFRSLSRLVNAYLAQRNYAEAITLTQAAADANEKDTAVLALLARLYDANKQPEKSREIYERLKKIDPTNPLPLIVEAGAALKAKDLNTAEARYRQALKLRDDDRYRKRLVDILIRQKRNDEAVGLIDEALDNLRAATPEKESDKRRQALRLVGFLHLKSRVRLIEGNARDAIALMKQAIQTGRDRKAQSNNHLLHYELASIYLRLKPVRVKEAEEELNNAIGIRDDFMKARLSLVGLLVGVKRFPEAEVQCMHIIERGPNLQAYMTLGDMAIIVKKDMAAAIGYYTKGAEAFPKDPTPQRKLAELHVKQGDVDKGIRALEKTVALAKYSPQSIELFIRTLIANKRYVKAMEVCGEEIKNKRNEGLAYLLMGNVAAAQGHYAEARGHYDMSRDKGGDNPLVHFERAQTYEAEENYDKAIEEARAALKIQPGFEEAYRVIESVYRKQKKNDDLEKLYREWIVKLPQSVYVVNNYAWFANQTKKKPDEALKIIRDFRKNVARGRRNFRFAADLCDTEGWILHSQGRYQEAVDVLTEAIKLNPRSASAFDHRRQAYARLMKQATDRLTAERYAEMAEYDFRKARMLMPDNPILQRQLGDARLAKGKFSEAVKAYERSLELQDDPVLRRRLARMLIRDGRLGDAQNHIKTLIEKEPKEPANLVIDAELKSANGEHDKAIQLLDALIKVHPKLHMAHYVVAGEYFVKAGQLSQKARRTRDAKVRDKLVDQNRQMIEKGREALNKTIELQPKFLGARLLKARLAGLEQRYDVAIKEVQEVLKIDPNNFEAAYNLGQFHLANKEIGKAEAQFEGMIRKWPDSVAARLVLANLHFRQKKYDKALAGFREAHKRDPRSPQILRSIAVIHRQRDRADLAMKEYRDYLKRYENVAQAWLELAALQEQAKMLPAAELSLKKAIEGQSGRAIPHATLVSFYLRYGRAEDARRAAEDMVRKVPGEEDKIQGRILIAQSYENEQDFDRAIERYRGIVRDVPKNPFAMNNLAWLLLTRKNQPDEAIKLAEPMLKDNPGFSELYDTVGWAYHLKNENDKAEPLLRHAVGAKRAQGVILPSLEMHLADVLFLNEKYREAKILLDRLAKIKFKDQTRAKELLDRIEKENLDKKN